MPRPPDSADGIFFTFDDTLLEWNRATSDLTGYSDEELAAATPSELLGSGEEDASRVRDAIEGATETGRATVETGLRTPDGDRVHYEVTIDRLRSGDGSITFAADGRPTEERTRLDQERRDILNRMSDAFFALDTDWKVTYANDAATAILSDAMVGDPPEDLRGVDLWEAIPDAVDTTFYRKYHAAMERQDQITFEEYYEPLDTWFNVRVYPSETGISVYFYDVTDHRRQREALEHRQQVLRNLYEITADRTRLFGEQVEALLELGRAELDTDYGSLSEIRGDEYTFEVVSGVDDRVQAGDVVPLSATNCELAASREETVVLGDIARDAPGETDRAGNAEWGISCYIGAPVFVDESVYGTFCFYDTEARSGRFSDWEVTLVDLMSRWVGYELQRKRANERLQRQNAKLEQFASVVSHDLRNPLSVLDGAIELAEETGDERYFESCNRAIDRMQTLIDDLLTLASAGAAIDETGPVDLGDVARLAWQGVATEGATLRVDAERTVRADESRLRQLLENLLRNSVEHGVEGVTVTVGDLSDGFYLEDDGPGIPPEDRDTVFERNYSTSADGTGFGLAIVREIANAHDWTVRVTEAKSGGARFEFTTASGIE